MSQTPQTDRLSSFWVAWSVVMLLIVGFEGPRWLNPDSRAEALSGWLCGREGDWLPFLPVFLAGVVIWQVRGKSRGVTTPQQQASTTAARPPSPSLASHLGNAVLSLLLGVLAAGIAAWTGWDMRDLPPAYHDEFSYLFQALTFLDGRTWFPSFEAMPQLFDQMHVLNEGHFASRYFPGAGVWFALFHGVGTVFGLWLAQGIVAVGTSIVAGEIAGRTARVLAGLAVACGPGLCLFSQLYLAHLPTLVGLTLFLVFMLRLWRGCESANHGTIEHPQTRWLQLPATAFLAGCGLSFAMLCRPMTAAGVGLPFGVWLFEWFGRGLRKNRPSASLSPKSRIWILFAMGLPIMMGIAVQLAYNHSITGKAFDSPYQLYTDLYTPRHGYGFNNVIRGEQHLGPKVLENYDRWAENLTLPLAMQKMGIRMVASGRWTLGLVPLCFVIVWLIWNWSRWSGELKLIVASIASLHLVHLPYWFEGIMGWHYVFESAPLWGIVLGVVSTDFNRQCRETGHGALRSWWGSVLAVSLAVAWFTVTPLWPGRLPVGLAEVRYSRDRYALFDEQLQQHIHGRGIVFVHADPSDRHIDYVYNTPGLGAPILRAHAPPSEAALQQAIPLFPDREPWLFDAVSGKWTRLNQQ